MDKGLFIECVTGVDMSISGDLNENMILTTPFYFCSINTDSLIRNGRIIT